MNVTVFDYAFFQHQRFLGISYHDIPYIAKSLLLRQFLHASMTL